jgi:4-hydroxy-tetrahydrodipicolinate synthase
MHKLFTGLSAFPLTPADPNGIVDTAALGVLVNRLVTAGVDSIGLLGSTGIYAYLDRVERGRAVAAAVEAAGGRVPLIVGAGALRTSWAIDLARDAERAGASGLLLAPVSYAALTDGEAAAHYRAAAGATGLPLCIYNNPGTTNFIFSNTLIAELATVAGIAAIKMPPPADHDYAVELARLRATTPETFAIGYSGDWGGGRHCWLGVTHGTASSAACCRNWPCA